MPGIIVFLWVFSTCQLIFAMRRMSKRIAKLEQIIETEKPDVNP